MPSINVYTNQNLPVAYEHQIRSYVRMLWYDPYLDGIGEPLVPEERHPQYIVFGEGEALYSSARVNWVAVNHVGKTFKVYCLGDVFTYPAFRKRGYGQQVVEFATNNIREDTATDVAILFTDPNLEKFYAQSGWEHVPELRASIGSADAPEDYSGAFAMMMFLSHTAKMLRDKFVMTPIFLPGYGW